MKTRAISLPPSELTRVNIDAMWVLFDRFYEGISREVFERDLLIKSKVLFLKTGDRITGFTSTWHRNIDGYRVIFAGDTIIEPEARNIATASMFSLWLKEAYNQFDWWCVLSSGPRTFRIPHTFFKRIAPSDGAAETETERSLRHRFASSLYGEQYDPERGIVTLSDPYWLRDPQAQMRENYPLYEYYIKANPGWIKGDELVFMTSLHPDNWKSSALRMLSWKNAF